jgi:hypothetical protein
MVEERRLTRTQKSLVNELDEIMYTAGIDYWNIGDRDPEYDQVRTVVLQAIRRDIVRGIVISQYTLLDEQLGSKVSRYMFDNKKFMKLWRTRKFERFNYFVLEKMSLMEKLAFAKDVYSIPKGITSNIESINAMRNALAHAFFPENLRAYRTKYGTAFRKLVGPHYKGVDIFTADGVGRFLEDSRVAIQFFITDIRRKKGGKNRSALRTPVVPAARPIASNNTDGI